MAWLGVPIQPQGCRGTGVLLGMMPLHSQQCITAGLPPALCSLPVRAAPAHPGAGAEFAPVLLSGDHPSIPRAQGAHMGLVPCPKMLCCHLNDLEPVQEGVHSPEDEGRGKIPELRLLLEAERVHQRTELGWMGPVGPAASLAPTGNNVGIRLEQ